MKLTLNKERTEESWISVSDLMSGLMMIFLLIAIIYIHNFADQADQIEHTQKRICSDIVKEFDSQKEKWQMSICEDGLLVSFENDSVFDSGRSELKDDFKNILNVFFPRFMDIILKNAEDIQELRIEGHTSSEFKAPSKEKAYVSNTYLSQARSFSVMNYIFAITDNENKLNWMTHNLTAHGMSSSKLKFTDQNQEDKKRSRRVEFRIKTNIQDKLIEQFRATKSKE